MRSHALSPVSISVLLPSVVPSVISRLSGAPPRLCTRTNDFPCCVWMAEDERRRILFFSSKMISTVALILENISVLSGMESTTDASYEMTPDVSVATADTRETVPVKVSFGKASMTILALIPDFTLTISI